MRPSRQRVVWVTGLRVATVCSAGDLGGIEHHRLRHSHTLRAIQGVRAFFLDTPAIAAGVGGADSVGHRLLNNRRAAVVDVAGCSGSQTLSQLVVAGHLLHSRVCPVDRDADRHQRRAPASSVLAGVEAFAAQGVGDKIARLPILPLGIARCEATGDWVGVDQHMRLVAASA